MATFENSEFILKYINQDTLIKVQQKVKNSEKIVILTHKNPDGDAVGSSLGLYFFFKEMGATVDVIIPNETPSFFKWLPGFNNTINFSTRTKFAINLLQNADLFFCLDFNSLSRIDQFEKIWPSLKAEKVLIDHHPNPEKIADFVFSETNVSSTAELVYYFIKSWNNTQKLSKEIATNLYAGIMTDTGNFSFNSSNSATFITVAELLECGIEKDQIYANIYDNYSYKRMQLLGHVLKSRMVHFEEYRTAYIYITKEDIIAFDFQVGDSEGFVNYPLSIKDVVFSVLFIEKDDHIRISLRSKGSFEVNKISEQYFSGGGHKNAAGGESELSLDETLKKFNNLLPKYKNALLTS